MPDVPLSWDYTWPATSRPSGDGAGTIGTFFQNPVGTTLSLFGSRRGEPTAFVGLNVATGIVEVGGVRSDAPRDPGLPAGPIPLHPRARAARRLGRAWQQEQSRQTAVALSQAFRTGAPGTVAAPYRAIAEEIAGIGRAQSPEPSGGALDSDARFIEGGAQRSPPGPEFFMPRSIPGGAFGMAQQVPATISRVRGALGGASGKRKRPARPARQPRTRRVSKSRPARLVKGSAAARRHMAKLRAKRRRK